MSVSVAVVRLMNVSLELVAMAGSAFRTLRSALVSMIMITVSLGDSIIPPVN